MKKSKLGRTGLDVTRICLGTMTWGRQNTEADGHAQMDYAVECGINFFDTAEMYAVPPSAETYGKTETIIGNWFAKTGKRKDIILASKIAGANNLPWVRGGSPINRAGLIEAVEGSLKRLKTDYIDLYQLHWPNRPYPHHGRHWGGMIDFTQADEEADRLLEILETLAKLVGEGKIRHFGLSNDSAWGVMKYLNYSELHDLPRVASLQNEYSLLYRVDEPYLSEICVREDVAYLPYSPLGGGMISGKYLNGARPQGSRWAIDERKLHRDTENAAKAIRGYMDIAERHGLDICQMALKFCDVQNFVTSTIIGATTMEQLKTDIAAFDVTLPDDVMQEIDAIYKELPVPY